MPVSGSGKDIFVSGIHEDIKLVLVVQVLASQLSHCLGEVVPLLQGEDANLLIHVGVIHWLELETYCPCLFVIELELIVSQIETIHELNYHLLRKHTYLQLCLEDSLLVHLLTSYIGL